MIRQAKTVGKRVSKCLRHRNPGKEWSTHICVAATVLRVKSSANRCTYIAWIVGTASLKPVCASVERPAPWTCPSPFFKPEVLCLRLRWRCPRSIVMLVAKRRRPPIFSEHSRPSPAARSFWCLGRWTVWACNDIVCCFTETCDDWNMHDANDLVNSDWCFGQVDSEGKHNNDGCVCMG